MRVLLGLVFCLVRAAVCADPAVLAAVNDARAKAGRAPLVYDSQLEAAARTHGEDMVRAGFFSHEGSDGSDLGTRVARAGYPACFAAENIARGQRDLAQVMASWMGSRGHRRNILDRRAEAVALWAGPGDTWVMVLGRRC